MNRELLKSALALGLVALIATGVVATVHQLTAQRIDTEAQREARGRTLLELLPRGSYDNHPLETEVSAFDPKLLGRDEPAPAYIARLRGQATAVVLQPVAPDGYGGSIQLLVGVTAQGRLLGVRVVAHQETPGLGDRIELGKSRWLHGFDGTGAGRSGRQWLGSEEGRRPVRPVRRRHHHPARGGQGHAPGAAVLRRAQSRAARPRLGRKP